MISVLSNTANKFIWPSLIPVSKFADFGDMLSVTEILAEIYSYWWLTPIFACSLLHMPT